MADDALIAAGAALVAATQAYVTAVEVAVGGPQPRPPRPARAWPFNAGSPWNELLEGDVALAGDDHETTRNLAEIKANVNYDQWSVALYYATRDDPMAQIVGNRTSNTAIAYVPAGAQPTGGDDRHVFIVQPDGPAWDCYKFARIDDEHYTAEVLVEIPTITGEGTGAGTRAAKTPSLAGLITAPDDMEHALALALPGSCLKMGFVPPATQEDADAETSYTGTIPMGTRVALLPDAPVPDTEQARDLARALTRRGAYVVDRSSNATIYAEMVTDDQTAAAYKTAWQALFPYMRVVL